MHPYQTGGAGYDNPLIPFNLKQLEIKIMSDDGMSFNHKLQIYCISILLLVGISTDSNSIQNGIELDSNTRLMTFYEVHSWTDSECGICHINSTPESWSAELVDEDLSRLCESCHAGSATILRSSISGISNHTIGNHPVKFSPLDFDPVKINQNIIRENDLFYVSGRTGKVLLFGDTADTAIVECSSCHDPHGISGLPNLPRLQISEEEFCVICHISINISGQLAP